MFCSKCGVARGAGPFCPACGAAAESTKPEPRKTGLWRAFTRGAGGILLVAFFLPWVAVSCDVPNFGSLASATGAASKPAGKPESVNLMQASGFQLATGPTIDMGITTQRLPSHGSLWFLVLAAIVMIAVTFILLSDVQAAPASLGASLVGFLVLFQASQSSSQNPQLGMVHVDYKPGLWLTIAALLGALLSALLGLRAGTRRT